MRAFFYLHLKLLVILLFADVENSHAGYMCYVV